MSNVMEYKGYVGTVEFSPDDMVFFGKVQGIRSVISYEGTNAVELVEDFHAAVDDYLDSCERNGDKPETAFKGTLNVRLGADTHREAAIYAMSHNQSLNSFIDLAVREKLATYDVKKPTTDK